MTSTISDIATTRDKNVYVYLQRPDDGRWVTVGRYTLHATQGRSRGTFRYAPSYLEAGMTWAIDPVNLPLHPDQDFTATRYHGLHDALRDAAPDAWGQAVLRREKELPAQARDFDFLLHANNQDRWGALAIGRSKTPPDEQLARPKIHSLEAFANELVAMSQLRPPINKSIRKMIIGRTSVGGARPKGVVQDDAGDTWLIKPKLPTDTSDVPLLEHLTARFGSSLGIRFANTVHERFGDGLSVLRVQRFDRIGERRLMAISGATMLGTEFPGAITTSEWSYPRLAEELLRIGTPPEDRLELFRRMLFNAVVGNDDDHPRNHAAIYVAEEKRWRLSPAFDVVPNWDEQPTRLTMQTSLNSFVISRESVLANYFRFGFSDKITAEQYLDTFLREVKQSHADKSPTYPSEISAFFDERLAQGIRLLN